MHGSVLLRAWLAANEVGVADFSASLKPALSPYAVWSYLAGRRCPQLSAALSIEAETKRRTPEKCVPASAWLEPAPADDELGRAPDARALTPEAPDPAVDARTLTPEAPDPAVDARTLTSEASVLPGPGAASEPAGLAACAGA